MRSARSPGVTRTTSPRGIAVSPRSSAWLAAEERRMCGTSTNVVRVTPATRKEIPPPLCATNTRTSPTMVKRSEPARPEHTVGRPITTTVVRTISPKTSTVRATLPAAHATSPSTAIRATSPTVVKATSKTVVRATSPTVVGATSPVVLKEGRRSPLRR